MKPVKKDFFLLPPLRALPDILGKILMVDDAGGRIVEAEAYLGEDDPGSFAYKGRKGLKRDALYRPAGSVFVYKTHGHCLLNIIFQKEDTPGAILIRAIEPLFGIEKMKIRRRKNKLKELCSGPGKLTQALGITMEMDGTEINSGPIKLFEGKINDDEKIGYSGRIGIKQGANLLYRAFIINSEFLSRRGDSNP